VEVYEAVTQEKRVMTQEETGIKEEHFGKTLVKKEDEGDEDPFSQALTTTTQYRKEIEWSICLADRVVFVRQDEERGYLYHKTLLSDQLLTKNVRSIDQETSAWLIDYLNLRVPLTELYEEWSDKDEVFKRFAKRFTGIRMLRQDPWECLCA
jgi:N-glycosylase/DNA lyase